MVGRSAERLAEIIRAFNPSYIIFVKGNNEKLYNKYISWYIKPSKGVIALRATLRCNNPPVNNYIMTNKFFIETGNLAIVGANERAVVFNDVTKTGETVRAIKGYLIGLCGASPDKILTCGFITDIYWHACSETGLLL